jgi:hypothetical protein
MKRRKAGCSNKIRLSQKNIIFTKIPVGSSLGNGSGSGGPIGSSVGIIVGEDVVAGERVVPGVSVGEAIFGEIDGGAGWTIFLASHANLPIHLIGNMLRTGMLGNTTVDRHA